MRIVFDTARPEDQQLLEWLLATLTVRKNSISTKTAEEWAADEPDPGRTGPDECNHGYAQKAQCPACSNAQDSTLARGRDALRALVAAYLDQSVDFKVALEACIASDVDAVREYCRECGSWTKAVLAIWRDRGDSLTLEQDEQDQIDAKRTASTIMTTITAFGFSPKWSNNNV